MDRLGQPYLGHTNDRLWDKNNLMGRFMGPLEDLYFEFIPNDDLMKKLNFDRQRVVSWGFFADFSFNFLHENIFCNIFIPKQFFIFLFVK